LLATQRVISETLESQGINAEVRVMDDTKRGLVAKVISDQRDMVLEVLGKFAVIIEVTAPGA